MYSHCYKEMFSIYVVLEISCSGKEDIHKLREKVYDIYKFADIQPYKLAFNNAKHEGLISVEHINGHFIVKSDKSRFFHLINRYKDANTEFGKICKDIFELYKRKEVKDISIGDLLEIFLHKPNSRKFCQNLLCRKYFVPHYSQHYCDDCYKKESEKGCPKCIEKNRNPINKIFGRMHMCSDCSHEKSEILSKAIEKENELPSINCKLCGRPFTPLTKRSKYCSDTCKQLVRNYKKCTGTNCIQNVLKQNKTGLCAVCTAEKQGDVVDRLSHIIIRKCQTCDANIHINYKDRTQLKIKKCKNCMDKKKLKPVRFCPRCTERGLETANKLKGKQQICRPCKRFDKQEKEKHLMTKCETPSCPNSFKRSGRQKYCSECNNRRKLFKDSQKRRRGPYKVRPVMGNVITLKFEDRFYDLMNKLIDKISR